MIIHIAISEEMIKDALAVRKAVFVKEQGVPLDIELDEHDETAIHLVGYLDNKPIAAGRIRLLKETGKLERLSILKSYRGKGYGRQMIGEMEEILRDKDIGKSILNAQTHALAFYQELGYQIVSDFFVDAGIEHVTMEKSL